MKKNTNGTSGFTPAGMGVLSLFREEFLSMKRELNNLLLKYRKAEAFDPHAKFMPKGESPSPANKSSPKTRTLLNFQGKIEAWKCTPEGTDCLSVKWGQMDFPKVPNLTARLCNPNGYCRFPTHPLSQSTSYTSISFSGTRKKRIISHLRGSTLLM